MLQKDVVISIYGKQTDDQGNEDVVELVTTGMYFHDPKEEHHRLEYEETEVSGVEGTHTRIDVKDGIVSISRSGSSEGHMQLTEGQKYVSSFSTPIGMVELGFFPTKVDTDLSDSSGNLDLEYQMDIDGTLLGVNHLKVSYRA
ncbi:MAG: DUF1934 domain-containing protein [Christensenellales bacterium]|jgi:uncharacterized beta-barrel protein YwiB (DUF1934 family)